MKKRSKGEIISEIHRRIIQLQGLVHFLSHYDEKGVVPLDINERFWGFGSTMETKLEKIRNLLNQLEEKGE